MKILTIFSTLCFFAIPSLGQELPPMALERVVDVISLDFNDDGYQDRAVLFEDKGDTSIGRVAIYLREDHRLVLHSVLAEEVWVSRMHGDPALDTNRAGSLMVHSENIAIGRNRWRQSLTIAYRDKGFYVAGFDYLHYDTLNLDNSGRCDLNLFTGRGEITDNNDVTKQIRFERKRTPITKWNSDYAFDICFPDGF